MPTARRINKMMNVLKNRQPDLTVVCENIHDPHNVSAIIRTCDAVGIEKINLLYTLTPFPQLGVKSSASAKKWIETVHFKNMFDLQETLKNQGFLIYATCINEKKSTSIYEIDWTKPSAIILGNEHRGVSDEILSIADQYVYIPMFGMIDSLNVSVAAAVILYEACRQRMNKGRYPNPFANQQKLKETLDRWIEK